MTQYKDVTDSIQMAKRDLLTLRSHKTGYVDQILKEVEKQLIDAIATVEMAERVELAQNEDYEDDPD